jgi:hypothetical protein
LTHSHDHSDPATDHAGEHQSGKEDEGQTQKRTPKRMSSYSRRVPKPALPWPLTATQDGISNISRVANAAAENIDRAFASEADKVHALVQATSRIERGLRELTTEMSDRMQDMADGLERMVKELSVAVDVLSRRKSWLRFLWPFGRR